jgi:hypothetical protein
MTMPVGAASGILANIPSSTVREPVRGLQQALHYSWICGGIWFLLLLPPPHPIPAPGVVEKESWWQQPTVH